MRTIMEHGRAAFWAAFLLVLLTGCAIQGVPEPQSAQERIVRESIRAQNLANAAELTSMDLLERGAIGSDQAEKIAKAAEDVRFAARQARTLLASDWNNTDGALAYLQAADLALKALETFVNRSGK